jgi:hypothetical protein
MMVNNSHPLKVALYAMDERSVRTMVMYLQGPCKGVATVVDAASADIDIFDGDNINAKKLLAERLTKSSTRPLIILSLQNAKLDNALYVKKPVKSEDMLGALAEVKARLDRDARPSINDSHVLAETSINDTVADKPILRTYALNKDERNKTTKHQTATQMNEAAFGAFIGSVQGVDVNDPRQFFNASYRPGEHFQGYIQSAIQTCHERGEILEVYSGWRLIILFPQSREIWLDADDKQLRAFAGLKLENTPGSKMSLSPLKQEPSALANSPEKFQSMDTFAWKLACWTSKGRYPDSLNIELPVYLKNWPNFTRLMITPHAMRIAALMVQEPRTLGDIASILKIKPQYVFVFISAAHALGLVGQARREADVLVVAPEIKPSQKQSLLSRIISKLRGSNA